MGVVWLLGCWCGVVGFGGGGVLFVGWGVGVVVVCCWVGWVGVCWWVRAVGGGLLGFVVSSSCVV